MTVVELSRIFFIFTACKSTKAHGKNSNFENSLVLQKPFSTILYKNHALVDITSCTPHYS